MPRRTAAAASASTMKISFILIVLSAIFVYHCASGRAMRTSKSPSIMPWPYPKPVVSPPYDEEVKEILSRMKLREKIGQMIQLDIIYILKAEALELDIEKLEYAVENYYVGSFLNSPTNPGLWGKVHNLNSSQWIDIISQIQTACTTKGNKIPMIYGLDSVHGANYIDGATLFPQQIGSAATFCPELIEQMGAVTAKDTRAVGIPWLFAPILDIAVQPIWPRVYETFGEDPYLASVMGAAIIRGMQGDGTEKSLRGSNTGKVAACAKHFLGYSNPRSGSDRSPSWIPDRLLWQYFIPSFRAAVGANVRTFMESYNEINGVPVASSSQYLKDLLRDELGFNGMLVTDYAEIEDLHDFHKVAATQEDAVKMAMMDTSIDMSMVPLDTSFADYVYKLVKSGEVPAERIDIAAGRILQLKKDLGLFEDSMPDPHARDIGTIGSKEDRELALDICRESVTLLKNDNNVLPITVRSLKKKRILVAGPSCDSISYQTGGWSVHWQGAYSDDEFPYGITVLDALKAATMGSRIDIVHEPGCDIDGEYTKASMASLISLARQSDVAVVCLGENVYAERFGDITDMTLPQGQQDVVAALNTTGLPIVVVLFQGRPRVLNEIPGMASSVVNAFLPGPDGGRCVAEILLGMTNPSGKMPISYPESTGALLQYYHKVNDMPVRFQWEFGHGLSYTTFWYSNLRANATVVHPGDYLQVSVSVTNKGQIPGKETVLLYLADDYRRVTPEIKMLKAFKKLDLRPSETKDVEFTLTTDDLAYYGVDKQRVIEEGSFTILCADISLKFTLVFA